MELVIKINCDNEAFEPRISTEIHRILNAYLSNAHNFGGLPEYVSLFDRNGNRVGQAEFVDDSGAKE